MPDLLAGWLPDGVTWAGLVILLVTAFVAGVVYGFAGFGAALLFLPVAARVVPLEIAIAAFAVSALASLVTVVPRAWREIDQRAISVQIAMALLSSSAGIWVLHHTDVTVLRWAVVLTVALTLLALVSGWRYPITPTLRTRAYIGLGSGFVGGSTGLLGPVAVIFQLAGQDSAARSRASSLVFLTMTSVFLMPLMALQGVVTLAVLPLGLIMMLPYGLGTWLGRVLFRPGLERFYRGSAYGLIALAVVLGLPVFD